jgi:hypothetical protein
MFVLPLSVSQNSNRRTRISGWRIRLMPFSVATVCPGPVRCSTVMTVASCPTIGMAANFEAADRQLIGSSQSSLHTQWAISASRGILKKNTALGRSSTGSENEERHISTQRHRAVKQPTFASQFGCHNVTLPCVSRVLSRTSTLSCHCNDSTSSY